eukprot:g753.t1
MAGVEGGPAGSNQQEDNEGLLEQESTFDGTVSTKERRFRLLDPDTLPASFSANTNKEDLCLEYVSNFESQFHAMCPARTRRVLFSPFNECDVRKFICTTVRPTELPFRALYDADEAARFVSDLLDFEPLDPPTEVPERVPSPHSVLKWRVGDCFDFSILLTSFLLGAGYDAYCVHGYAPRWVTSRDQSRRAAPALAEPDPASEAVGKAGGKEAVADAKDGKDGEEERYKVRRHGMPVSKFDAAAAEAKRADDEAREAKADVDSESDADVDEFDDEDPHDGQRVHAWVLVCAGPRDVGAPFFLEPTTAARYEIADAPYTGVEAIWSSKNHYINMQEGTEVRELSWDVGVVDDWENVFIEPLVARAADEGEDEDGDGDGGFGLGDDEDDGDEKENEAEEEDVDDSTILDLPASWVPLLEVPHALYQNRYWAGSQSVTLFRRAKHERYIRYAHPHGMLQRLSLFKDALRTVPKEVRELFANRRDQLVWRQRHPLAGLSQERFLQGRPEGLKERREFHGRTRELRFYGSARGDGLVQRTDEIGRKIVLLFEGRDDNLEYRSVRVTTSREEAGESQYTLPGEDGGPEQFITKMTEKFAPDLSKPEGERVHKQTYYCSEGRIRTIYHFAALRVTAATRTHYKDPSEAPAAALVHTFEQTNGAGATHHSEVDQAVVPPTDEQLAESFNEAMLQEKDCFSEARAAAREVQQLLALRKDEARAVKVEKTMFDTALEKALAHVDARSESQAADNDDVEDGQEMDYLAPFLPGGRAFEDDPLSREEAQKVAKACLEALKERLLERANIIQRRLDAENSSLAKRQASFQRSQQRDDQAGDEEFERFCSETMFRIQILEQRLSRHESTAMQRYAELDRKLHSDARLNALVHN